MKYIKQFCLILAIAFLSEVLAYLIDLPVPSSIYGIVILFTGLLTHWIALDSVKETGLFLVEIMPVMFIPAAVGLMDSWALISSHWFSYIVVTLLTTVIVMAVSGKVTDAILKGGHHE